MQQPGLTDAVQNIHENRERLKEMKVWCGQLMPTTTNQFGMALWPD